MMQRVDLFLKTARSDRDGSQSQLDNFAESAATELERPIIMKENGRY